MADPSDNPMLRYWMYEPDLGGDSDWEPTTADVLAKQNAMYSGPGGGLRSIADMIPASGRTLDPRGEDESLPSYWLRAVKNIGALDMAKAGLGTAANWLQGTPEIGPDTLAPLGLAPMGSLVGHSATLAKPSIADHARARYLEWKNPDDFPAISGGEGQFNSAKYLAEKDRMTHDNPHSIRNAAEPIATDPDASVINNYARNVYKTHNDVLQAIEQLQKAPASSERDAALAKYRQMRFRTATLLDELDPPEFLPANEPGKRSDRLRLLSENNTASTPGLLLNSLPMDERLNRAREMGFDIDTPYYHGTDKAFDAFDPSRSGETFLGKTDSGGPIYFAKDPTLASHVAEYKARQTGGAPNVIPVFLRNAERGADPREVFTYRPEDIRSVNSAFDPAQSHSANLLAADTTRSSVPGTVVNAQEDDPENRMLRLLRQGYQAD